MLDLQARTLELEKLEEATDYNTFCEKCQQLGRSQNASVLNLQLRNCPVQLFETREVISIEAASKLYVQTANQMAARMEEQKSVEIGKLEAKKRVEEDMEKADPETKLKNAIDQVLTNRLKKGSKKSTYHINHLGLYTGKDASECVAEAKPSALSNRQVAPKSQPKAKAKAKQNQLHPAKNDPAQSQWNRGPEGKGKGKGKGKSKDGNKSSKSRGKGKETSSPAWNQPGPSTKGRGKDKSKGKDHGGKGGGRGW